MGMMKRFAEAISVVVGKDGGIDDEVCEIAGALMSLQEKFGLTVEVSPEGIFISAKEQKSRHEGEVLPVESITRLGEMKC